MVDYLNEGVTDEVAIRAEMEAKQIPVTTADLTMANERLRTAQPAGTPPTVAQVAAAEGTEVPTGMKTAAAGAATPAAAPAAPPPTPPINSAAQPTNPAAQPKQSAPNQGATPPTQPTPLIIPPEVQVPVAEIDDFIRQGYDNTALEAIMKVNHQTTYRNVIRRRRIELDAELAEKAAAMVQRAAANPAAQPAANIPVNPQIMGNLGTVAPTPQLTVQQPTQPPAQPTMQPTPAPLPVTPQSTEPIGQVIAARI
jgi:hypothetical protein